MVGMPTGGQRWAHTSQVSDPRGEHSPFHHHYHHGEVNLLALAPHRLFLLCFLALPSLVNEAPTEWYIYIYLRLSPHSDEKPFRAPHSVFVLMSMSVQRRVWSSPTMVTIRRLEWWGTLQHHGITLLYLIGAGLVWTLTQAVGAAGAVAGSWPSSTSSERRRLAKGNSSSIDSEGKKDSASASRKRGAAK